MTITWITWTTTLGVIAALFAFDLVMGLLYPHRVGFKEAALWSIFYIAIALGFGIWVGHAFGGEYGAQYFTGYIIEKSLSVDNIFVFVIIMSTFAVPEKRQQEALTFGILLSLLMRALFIALGATLISRFSFTFLIFGLLLVYTAIQLFRNKDNEPDIENSRIVRFIRKFFPVSSDYAGGSLIHKTPTGWVVTPLLVVLVTIGGVDLLFAMDSIPAVFGVTNEGFIVFTVNAFALLGLRALFFLVKGLLDRLVYLSTGLALILAFIGLKLILHWANNVFSSPLPEISTSLSLVVVVSILVLVAITSFWKTHRDATK